MRLLLEAGPLALALDTSPTSPASRTFLSMVASSPPVEPSPTQQPAVVRTVEESDEPDDDGDEMWVVRRTAVEQWLALAADRGPEGLPALMVELDVDLDVSDLDGGQVA